MKHFGSAALALCLMPAMATAEDVSIATLNTFWLFDDTEPHLSWFDRRPGQDYQTRLEKVAGAIESIDADIVALQEVEGPEVVADLVDILRDRGVDYPHFWTGQGLDAFTGQNVALLSRYGPLIEPVLRYPSALEDYTEDRGGFPRVAALQKLMRVDLDVEGEAVTLFVAHLKSQRGGETSEEERLAQARMLRRLARAVAEKGNPLVAIVGDLNDDVKSPTLNTLLGETDGSYPFEQPSLRIAEADRWTHSFDPPDGPIEREQLDHVIVNKFLNDRVEDAVIIRLEDDVSDHDAFKVTFSFPD